VVAIVDETFCGHTHKHTNTHTDKHSSDFISVQCHELHWTDKNVNESETRKMNWLDIHRYNTTGYIHVLNISQCHTKKGKSQPWHKVMVDYISVNKYSGTVIKQWRLCATNRDRSTVRAISLLRICDLST